MKMNDLDIDRWVQKINNTRISEPLDYQKAVMSAALYGSGVISKPGVKPFERPNLEDIQGKISELLWEHTSRDETPEGAEEISKYVDELLTKQATLLSGKIAELEQKNRELVGLIEHAEATKQATLLSGKIAELVRLAAISEDHAHPHAEARADLFGPKVKRPPLPKSAPIK